MTAHGQRLEFSDMGDERISVVLNKSINPRSMKELEDMDAKSMTSALHRDKEFNDSMSSEEEDVDKHIAMIARDPNLVRPVNEYIQNNFHNESVSN
jgi:hypothetical protein